MATWNQSINSGGFLSGMGQSNSNAPQADAVNPTLGMIRDNNDRERSGQNNLGLQLLGAAGGVSNMWRAQKQQEAQNAFNQAHATAWKSGDSSSLRDFAEKNPAFVAQAQQAVAGLNDQQRADMGRLATGANVALSQGPEAYSKFVQDNSADLTRIGADPNWMLRAGAQNPEQLSHFATTLALGAVGPDKYLDAMNQMRTSNVAQQNANTSTFSAQQNARQGDERLAIDRYKAQSGADLAAEELKLKALLGKAQNDTARGNLQQKLDAVNKARDEKINSVAGNVADFGRAAAVGTELGSLVNQHPTAVSRNQGGLMGWAPNVADDTRTLASKTDEYNLKVILPALKGTFGGNPTEGERAALMQSSNNLKKATSNEDFLKELNKAQDTIVQMQKRQIRGLGIPVTKSQDETTDTQMLLSDPSLVEEYIRAHGYLPESYYQAQLKGAK
ncbi:phage DNA ejection protein [Serratia marcescens]|uniref:phage DNA ejection protein n=1 Tax=Serratia marcescens TaxID=615 RepID=UPI0024A75B1F|nr:phage DNA ejection protein [Serratia marcescens]